MAHPICQYMGITSFPIQPGNDVWKKLGKHLVVNRFIAAHSVTQGRIGLKFDIFGLMFYEIFVMHIHNSHLVYNFYEQAIKLFL